MTQYAQIVADKRFSMQPGHEPSDLRGKRFGLLIARDIEETSQVGKGGAYHWLCDCDCGTLRHRVRSSDLSNGHTQSCGCLKYKKAGPA